MRSDMSKVVIERPRYGHKDPSKKTGKRIHRYDPGDEYEDLPQREPASKGRGTKEFTDFLNPLERFLRSNVGRPWDKVYSELCAHLDRRKTTGRHVFQHLEDFVEVDCFVGDDGVLYAGSQYDIESIVRIGEKSPIITRHRAIGEYRGSPSFYVDPRSGLLCLEKKRTSQTTRERLRRNARSTMERKPISFEQSYLRLNGIWYIADYVCVEGKAPTTPQEEMELPLWKKLARKELGVRYWIGKGRWMEMVSKRKGTPAELRAAGLQNVSLKK